MENTVMTIDERMVNDSLRLVATFAERLIPALTLQKSNWQRDGYTSINCWSTIHRRF